MELKEIAELLGLHPSVIDNYYEEWQFQEKDSEEDHYEGIL
jgi:predicted solute-binding protein